MWGSSFADLARKAQELQDQAASSVTSSQGLFNLDAMQSSLAGIVETPETAAEVRKSKPVVAGDSLPMVTEEPSPPVNTSHAVSTPANSSAAAVDERSPKLKVSEEPKDLDDNIDNPPLEHQQEEGWDGDEEDIVDDDDIEPSDDSTGKDEETTPVSVEEPQNTVTTENEPSDANSMEQTSSVPQQQTSGIPAPSNNESERLPDEAPVADTTISEDTKPVVSTMDRAESPAKAPIQPISLPSTPTNTAQLASATTPDHPPNDDQRQKLIILISSMPMNRQVQVHQNLALTVLKSNAIDFEVLDGVEEKDLRNELFSISDRRGEYPQFFLVNLAAGGTTFWGGWEEFHAANENGQISNVFPTAPSLMMSPDVPVKQRDNPKHNAPDEGMLQQFAEQIKRIEDNHQAERATLEEEHAKALAEAGNHEKCEALRQEIETRLGQQIQAKENQIQELCRRNEGYRLKLDVLKREVTGTQEILQQKDSTAGKVGQQHLNELRNMEKKLVQAETNATQMNERCQQLQTTLTETKTELAASRKEHGDLKERVKLVATELKERRVECRDLNGKIESMETEHQRLQDEIESLKDKVSHQGLNQTEKDGEMDSLRSQLDKANEVYKKAEREWKEKEMKHEQAMADYKKKAQHSLSMANSRTAAAVQAREEAELDARAARSTADSAFERASAAELSSKEAVAEAKAALQAMERERDEANRQMKSADEAKHKISEELAAIQANLTEVISSRDQKGTELESLRAELRSEQSQIVSLRHQHQEMELSKKKLHGEIETLKIQLEGTKRALEAVDKTKDSEQHSINAETFSQKSDDGTVAALRQELTEANASIDYLKDALKNAVEMNEKSAGETNGAAPSSESSDDPNDGLPLFYAMEKQAELKTARAEINRLANELANLQSEKSEAVEAMNSMRQRMEESEAKLRRFEKLAGSDDGEGSKQNGVAPTNGSRSTNIEYLKHIMLKYITAKTTAERKALVPVIGAVLELTSDELTRALASAEQSVAASSSFFGLM